MAGIEITDVALDHEQERGIAAASLASPAAGERFPGHSIALAGWVAPSDAPLVSVEVSVRPREGGRALLLAATEARERRDVQDSHPDLQHALRSGFHAGVSTLGVEREFELIVNATIPDGTRLRLATLRGRREPLETGFSPSIQPLLLISEGRSGSTWLANVLGSHPSIAAYEPFRFEPRVATYWLAVLRSLAEPLSYSQALQPEFRGTPWWTGECRVAGPVDLSQDRAMQGWLEGESVAEIARFCIERIERFYQRAAADRGEPAPSHFVERGKGDWRLNALLRELYGDPKEVFLIRDYRDIVCSVLAFNEKRGVDAFGRGQVSSDEEFVRSYLGLQAQLMLDAWRQRGDSGFLLRYEDLVLNPIDALTPLLEFAGLDANRAVAERMLELASANRPDRQLDHRTSSDPADSIGRWQRDLSPRLQDVCEQAFGNVLREFGYA